MKTIKKRIFSILTAFSLAIPFTAVPVDAATIDTEVQYKSEDVVIMQQLGLIDKLKKSDEPVTRSEFATAIAMLINDSIPEGKKIADLGSDDSGLYWMLNMGYISGYDNGNFEPKRQININEGLKMAFSVLGYDSWANMLGGYPAGYVRLAEAKNVFKGVSVSDEGLTFKNFVSMLKNIMDMQVLEYKGNELKEGEIILEKYRHIYKAEGILTANDKSGLYNGYDNILNDRVRFDDESYGAKLMYDNGYENLLGYNFLYYYKDDGNDLSIAAAVPRKNESIRIKSSDIVSFESGMYKYTTETNAQKTARIQSNTIILYNDAFSVDNKTFIPRNGDIELIDNNSDGRYEVLKIYDRTITVVDNAVGRDDIFHIYDKFDTANDVELDMSDEYKRYAVYGIDGTEKDLNAIVKGDVIEVEKTAITPAYYKITILSKDSDYLQSVNEENIVIGKGKFNTTYRLNELLNSGKIKLYLGENNKYDIYYTSLGNIAYICNSTGDEAGIVYRVGYLRKFYLDEEGDEYEARILDQSGTWITLKFKKTVKYNGVNRKSRDLGDLINFVGDLIMYKQNISGEIAEIRTSSAIAAYPAQMDDRFQLIYKSDVSYLRYYNTGNVFQDSDNTATGCYIPYQSIVFVLPTQKVMNGQSISEDFINVGTFQSYVAKKTDSQFDNVRAYSTTGQPGITGAAIVEVEQKGGLMITSSQPTVINNIYEAYDPDEGNVYIIEGICSGAEVKYTVIDERESGGKLPVNRGDVAFIHKDTNDKVILRDDYISNGMSFSYNCMRVVDYNDGDPIACSEYYSGYYGPKPSDKMTGGKTGKIGKVYDVDGTTLMLNCSSEEDKNSKNIIGFFTDWSNVCVWNKDEKKFHNGTISESISYKNGEVSSGSTVYVYTNNQTGLFVVYP